MSDTAARDDGEFVAKITGLGSSFQALYEIVPGAPAPTDAHERGLQTFATLGEARQWLEEQARRRGFEDVHVDEGIQKLPEDIEHPTRA
jgi:hypothetical protein